MPAFRGEHRLRHGNGAQLLFQTLDTRCGNGSCAIAADLRQTWPEILSEQVELMPKEMPAQRVYVCGLVSAAADAARVRK